MKRIQPTGCGYNTYICSGLPAITSTFIKGSTAIPMPIISGGTFASDKSAIPQQLEGFVMTLTPVIDMDTTELEIPELECRTEFNPFEISGDTVYKNAGADYTGLASNNHDGFLDFYLNGGTIGTPITEDSKTYKETVYIRVDGATTPVYVPDSDNPYILGGTWTFTDKQVVGPGILEPMVDTDFSPITIDTIPPQDAYFDTTTYLFDIFDAWRKLVDDRLNDLHDFVVDEQDFTLEIGKNLKSPCGNFQIVLATGTPLAPTKEYEDHSDRLAPKYWITGGTVLVNGYTVGVVGSTVYYDGVVGSTTTHIYGQTSGIGGPFDAYLVLSSGTQQDNPYTGRIVVTRDKTLTYNNSELTTYIGEVQQVNNDLPDNIWDLTSTFLHSGTEYTEFEIKQGDCITDIDWITGQSNGYVYMTVAQHGGRQYKTDRLLNYTEFNTDPLSDEDAIRGVQASAIQQYVSAHGGTGGQVTYEYDGPFKVIYNGGTATVFDGRDPDFLVAGYAFISGTYRLPVYSSAFAAAEPSDIYLVAYTQDPSSVGVAIYWQGTRYDADTSDVSGYYKWTAYSGQAQERSIYTTEASPQGGSTVYMKDSQNTMIQVGILDNPGNSVGFRYVVGDSSMIQVPDVWYTRIARLTGGTAVQQIQYGDVQVTNGGTSTATTDYHGPFKVSPTGDISCDVCGSTIQGYYVINGGTEEEVSQQSVSVAAGTTTNVYFNAVPVNGVITPSIDTTSSTAPNHYTVWLAQINGTTATQIHYGNIYIDGRWS